LNDDSRSGFLFQISLQQASVNNNLKTFFNVHEVVLQQWSRLRICILNMFDGFNDYKHFELGQKFSIWPKVLQNLFANSVISGCGSGNSNLMLRFWFQLQASKVFGSGSGSNIEKLLVPAPQP